MIDTDTIIELSRKYQTEDQNIVREYFQHLFLSRFYLAKRARQLLFKGGTALRLIWGSPRFSEDLDFSGFNISQHEIETLLKNALIPIERMEVAADILESKKTSGGFLARVLILLSDDRQREANRRSLVRCRAHVEIPAMSGEIVAWTNAEPLPLKSVLLVIFV